MMNRSRSLFRGWLINSLVGGALFSWMVYQHLLILALLIGVLECIALAAMCGCWADYRRDRKDALTDGDRC